MDDDFGDAGVISSRCDQDRYACQTLSELPTTGEACELDGELTVTIGTGSSAFSLLASGQVPRTGTAGGSSGSGQSPGSPGSIHAIFALRIEDAALDRYEQLAARIGIFEADRCTDFGTDRICDGSPWIADRMVVLGAGPTLNVVDGGIVEEYGLTASMDELEMGAYVIQAIVEDPCGQLGVSHHDFVVP